MSLHRKDYLRAQWGSAIIAALPEDGTPRTLYEISAATGCPMTTLACAIGQMPGSVVKIDRHRRVNHYRRHPSLCVAHA